jgi:hypothetical protein
VEDTVPFVNPGSFLALAEMRRGISELLSRRSKHFVVVSFGNAACLVPKLLWGRSSAVPVLSVQTKVRFVLLHVRLHASRFLLFAEIR